MTAVAKGTVSPFANSVLKIAVAGFAINFAITILNVESNDVHCMQDLESDLVERQPLYALPIADINPSERQPNPPAAGGERLGDSLAVASGIGRPNPPTVVGERPGDFPTAAGGIGTQLVPTTTSRVASTSPSPSMVSLVTVPPTPPPEIAASFGTSVVNAAADILVPPVTVTSFATAGFMAGGIVGREMAEAQAGPLLGDLGEMAGQTVGATAGTAVGSALVGCAKRSTSVPSRPVPPTQHPLPIKPLDMDRLSDVHPAESGTRGRSPRDSSMTQRFLMTPAICDRRRRKSPRDESLMITPDIGDFYKTSNESEKDKDRRGDQQHRFTFGRAKTPTKVDEPDCDLTAVEAHRGAPPPSLIPSARASKMSSDSN